MEGESFGAAAARPSGGGDFVIRHWRSSAPAARAPSLRRFRPATRPEILDLGRRGGTFPNGGGGGDEQRRPWAEDGTGGYTSLRDLIDSSPRSPGGVRSPATPRGSAGGEIRIKNHLVKQAAYAYLQPTPSASDQSDRRRRRRTLRRALSILTCGLAVEPLDACIAFLLRLFRRPRQ